jgi:hypothetical protein
VRAYGRIRFDDQSALAEMLKALGKGKARRQESPAPLKVMRTLSDLLPGLPEEASLPRAAGSRTRRGRAWKPATTQRVGARPWEAPFRRSLDQNARRPFGRFS